MTRSPPADPFPWTVAIAHRQRLSERWRGNIAHNYRFGRHLPATYQATLNLNRTFAIPLGLNLRLSQQQRLDGQSEFQARVNLNWFQPTTGRTVGASYEAGDGLWPVGDHRQSPRVQVRVNRGSRPVIGGVSRGLTITQSQVGQELESTLAHTGYRSESTLRHQTTLRQTALLRGGGTQHRSQLNLGTAIAFVGDRLGWSRPIQGSFAFVVPHPDWQGETIGINPIPGSYLGAANAQRPGVLPGLTPYQLTNLRLDAPEADARFAEGRNLGQAAWSLFPTYRSGIILTAGTGASLAIQGILVDEVGEPLRCKGGK